ncbi:MAG: SOS response-associated peptidase [Bacteroidota bacterium]|jgi:putative SOS response-associated peptidase YedK
MCYFNSLVAPKRATINLSGTTKQLDPINRPLQSGFSYHNWPIIKGSTQNFTIENAHWELIAPWVKTTQEVQAGREKFNTLNATAERLLESKLFKPATLNRRCLILSSGFYEWRHYKPAGASKEIAYPYFITLKNQSLFYMAGIFQPWTDKETGETMDTFSIVTTKANAFMEQIHNKKKRMPTILTEAQASEWLNPSLSESIIMELASSAYDANQLSAYTLDKSFRTASNPMEAFNYPELPGLI